MSTMLKTAAMSLLSKTLQTFLYKYLSDVDVEGVALPSVYDGSGWGVRLSNVKLREGVQLMEQMPGKQVKKRRRVKKKQKKRYISDDELADVDVDVSRHDEASLPQRYVDSGDDFPDGPDTPPPKRHLEHDFERFADEERLKQDGELQEASLHFSDAGQLRPTRSRASSTDELEVAIDDYGGDEQQDDPSPRPSTPLQDSKSIFSCFTKGKKGTKRKDADGGGDDSTATLNDMPELDQPADDASSKPPVSVVQEAPMNRQVSALAMDEKKEIDEMGASVKSVEPGMENETDNEDEFEEYEQPYKLCLGDSGRIGTLDIRLVDRDLHVMIEDAVLTIEAFPVSEEMPKEEGGIDGTSGDAKGKATIDGGASTASASTAPSKAAEPPKKPATKHQKTEPKRATVGDRVLADNPLARAISGIPHLLLRDVRIRFIIRKDPKPSRNGQDEGTEPGANVENSFPASNQPGPGDTMLEVGIEFLSVNSGEDILSSFQNREAEDSENSEGQNGEEGSAKPSVVTVQAASSSVGTPVDHNEYMIRHIRTGRGPAAGIWVQVFAPGPKLPSMIGPPDENTVWARQQWVLATNFHLLRCSGIDVRARIHLGSKKQVSSYSWFYDYDEDGSDFDYDDDTLDSMLVGFDSIAPGPQLPLPPINPDMSRGDTPVKTDVTKDRSGMEMMEPIAAMHPWSDKYTKDSNDIQSCKIPSTFHRISRGLVPGSCKDCTHFPSQTCAMCWNGPPTVPEESSLDSSMPMPGLALQVTFRDPLEINVDRPSVETLNLLKTLFVKKREVTADEPDPQEEKKSEVEVRGPLSRSSTSVGDTTKTTLSSRSSFFGFLSSRAKEPEKEEQKLDAFSPYMQPENIQVLGVSFSEVILRIHVMREEKKDDGLSFCYWDMLATCLTIDMQSCTSREVLSNDLRFDIGLFAWDEFCGIGCKRLVALGVPLHLRAGTDASNSGSTVKSMVDDHDRNKTPWPSAACALMDIPPPLETLAYKDRQGHGVQLRFISVRNPEDASKLARSMVNLRLGVTATQVPWGFWRDINSARQQVTWGILGKPVPAAAREVTTPLVKSIMAYTVQIDGGSIAMDPVINLKMPLTRVAGERSTETGISFESIFQKLQVVYGQKTPSRGVALSLKQMALLPENVRTRILFCLDDLKSFEEALEVKKESNPFKRTLAVSKGIVRMAKKLSKASASTRRNGKTNSTRSISDAPTRRQKIMTEIMKLDNNELDELWASHRRHQRKHAKN